MSADPHAAASDGGYRTRWLSQGVENLFRRLDDRTRELPSAAHYDVVVVGSGYGGAVAADALAGRKSDKAALGGLCVLERGKEYLPGAFPSDAADLPRHIRWSGAQGRPPGGTREGLFDFRLGPDVNALVGNGLGGGSLINAGVMLQPDDEVLAKLVPKGEDIAALRADFDEARRLLDTPADRTIGTAPLKFHALEALAASIGAGAKAEQAPISVAVSSLETAAGKVKLDACIGCGDCATGCNYNAKISLDTNLLASARRKGADLFTGATVLRIEQVPLAGSDDQLWCLHVVYTDSQLRQRHPSPFKLYARKVVLAAGTYGSTEILMRSRDRLLLSAQLGNKYSGNGDMIAAVYDHADANAVADAGTLPAQRKVGPTITGFIDTVTSAGARVRIQEMAVPAALQRVFEEIVTTGTVLQGLATADAAAHAHPGKDPAAIDRRAMGRTSVVAVMGDDGAQGAIEFVASTDPHAGDGAVRVRWPAAKKLPLFEEQIELLSRGKLATVIPNPLWRILPERVEKLLSVPRGPLLTVHPLGGCAMGASEEGAVVNYVGQVFGHDGRVYESLAVLDGSIVPVALGVNPALTITALALRAVRTLRRQWNIAEPEPREPGPRPRAAPVPVKVPERQATEIEFVERLSGKVMLEDQRGIPMACIVELTLRFDKVDLGSLIRPASANGHVEAMRTLDVGGRSELCVYQESTWRAWQRDKEGKAQQPCEPLLCAKVSGTLDFMHRAPTTPQERISAGRWAWLRNRGVRDLVQMGKHAVSTRGGLLSLLKRFSDLNILASRAGEVRLFEYDLKTGPVTHDANVLHSAVVSGTVIRGGKRVTYSSLGNPWKQLSQMRLTAFPGAVLPAVLKLDTDFLVQENAPMMRIIGQHDQPSALMDVVGLGTWLLRVLLPIHLWSFRKPDTPPVRIPQRLPAALPGLPAPVVTEIEVDRLPDGRPVTVRLTRYPRLDTPAERAPVVAIHGYSTSGTAFAHPALDPSLASYLWTRGHDVWIMDLRTSSGMPYARLPWTFEDAALADIPAAIEHIVVETGRPKVDVMAHCMGGAMMSMAILAGPKGGERFQHARAQLPQRIRKLVLSQVGPVMVFTQQNILRAFLMNYVRNVLPMLQYEFRTDGQPSAAEDLLDRLLTTLPYPDEEDGLEQPWWPFTDTSYTGTRHRMDALYGRAFNLQNMPRRVLDKLDDFFGPLSLATLGQAVHFARMKTIANPAGRNVYFNVPNLHARWTFPTAYIHGTDNGLSSVATMERMKALFDHAGIHIDSEEFPGLGHQDTWLGHGSADVFRYIDEYFKAPAERKPPSALKTAAQVLPPAAGPLLIKNGGGQVVATVQGATAATATGCPTLPSTRTVGLLRDPVLGTARYVAHVRVKTAGQHYRHYRDPQPGEARAQWLDDVCSLLPPDADEHGWIHVPILNEHPAQDGTLVVIVYGDSAVAANTWPADRSGLEWKGSLVEWGRPCSPADAEPIVLLHDADVQEAVLEAIGGKPGTRFATAYVAKPPVRYQGVAGSGVASLTFALGSCQYPPGILDNQVAYTSYQSMAARIRAGGPKAPAFLLLVGDQIYSDATAGLFDPASLDDRYRRPYEKLFANEHVREVLQSIPVYTMLDDHEVEDNWTPSSDPRLRSLIDTARSTFQQYQRLIRAENRRHRPLWYAFDEAGVRFFMGDTRTEREARSARRAHAGTIMTEVQMKALEDWLDEGLPDQLHFIATPAVIGLWRRDLLDVDATKPADVQPHAASRMRIDAWEGYAGSLHRLLAKLYTCERRVVLLSGDEHLSADIHLTIRRDGDDRVVKVRSIHSSALYAPYPFANSRESDFAGSGHRYRFAHGGDLYTCESTVTWHRGDGFALITVAEDGAGAAQVEVDWVRPFSEQPPAPASGPGAPPQTPLPSDSARPVSETLPTDAP